MIPQKAAAWYLAEEMKHCPIPMKPERFMRKRFTEHDFVHFGHVAVRAYKHANRWRFNASDVRNAGRAIAALPWDPEDLIDLKPGDWPQTEAAPRSADWRAQILDVIRTANDAVCKENGCSCGPPSYQRHSTRWALPNGLTPASLLHRYAGYTIACTLPIPTLVWKDETWLIPRTLSVILDRWEASERRLHAAVQVCSGCGAHSKDSSWRTPTTSGWKVLCPVCAAASLRTYCQSVKGITYAQVREKGPRAEEYLCAVCDPPRPATTWDHCHEHGLVRGPLCSSCNTMEGQGKDFLSRAGSVKHLLRCDGCRLRGALPAHHRLAALRRHLHQGHGVQGCDWPMHGCVSIIEAESGYECKVHCFGQRNKHSAIRLTASDVERILSCVVSQ